MPLTTGLHAFAGPGSCADWVQRLQACHEHWFRRDDHGLFTLGAAAYLDAPDGATASWFGVPTSPVHYTAVVERLNPLLWSTFADLYGRLRQVLARHLGVAASDIVYSEHKALPGFHIHGPHPAYGRQSNHVPHFDRPYAALDWRPEGALEGCDLDGLPQLSFTLTLQLPAAGGGLRIWPLLRSEAVALPPAELKVRLKGEHAKQVDYAVGSLLLHTGQELHQIRPWVAQPFDRERITLQGHGLAIAGRWILYW